jgi:hypothetical protein
MIPVRNFGLSHVYTPFSSLPPPPASQTTMTSRQPLWLRCEKKEFERRAALTPTTAKKLLDAGFDISVERDPQRIFDDAEYEA